MNIDEETLLRVRALRARGLSRVLASQLWSASDVSLLSDLEAATDDELRQLSRLESVRRRWTEAAAEMRDISLHGLCFCGAPRNVEVTTVRRWRSHGEFSPAQEVPGETYQRLVCSADPEHEQ